MIRVFVAASSAVTRSVLKEIIFQVIIKHRPLLHPQILPIQANGLKKIKLQVHIHLKSFEINIHQTKQANGYGK